MDYAAVLLLQNDGIQLQLQLQMTNPLKSLHVGSVETAGKLNYWLVLVEYTVCISCRVQIQVSTGQRAQHHAFSAAATATPFMAFVLEVEKALGPIRQNITF